MKKTQLKDSVRNISKRKAAYISVLLTITVGIAGLLCIFFVTAAFEEKYTDFYSGTGFMDLDIVSSLGLSENSISALSGSELVKDAEGVYSVSAMYKCGDRTGSANTVSLTERISVPELKEGSMPQKADECALDVSLADELGASVGDKITVHPDSSSVSDLLVNEEFTVTAVIVHPNSVSNNATGHIVFPMSAYSQMANLSGFTDAFTLLDLSAPDNVFSESYLSDADDAKEKLKPLLEQIVRDRHKELVSLTAEKMGVAEKIADEFITEDRGEGSFIIRDRKMNESFEELRNSVHSISRMGLFLSPLFAVVGSIVLFSTIAIIIEEQKKQVGTVKALGFHSHQIRSKYLLFGVSAAVIGCILGVSLSVLLEDMVLRMMSSKYTIGKLPTVVSPLAAAVIVAVTVSVVYLVVFAACSKLLSCSAIGLMNGSEPKARALTKKKKGTRKRSLYSELIINNVKTDKVRVIVGITIIACSGLLIGSGITIRQSFLDAFSSQNDKICSYDVQVTVSRGAGEDVTEAVKKVFADSGAEYAGAYYSGTVYENSEVGCGAPVLVMESADREKYFNLEGASASGLSVSRNIENNYGISEGSELTVCNDILKKGSIKVSGVFDYYVGTLLTMTPEDHRQLFGSDCAVNCYFAKAGGDGKDALISKLRDTSAPYSGYLDVTTAEERSEKFESVKILFDFVAVIFVGLAAVLDFLIIMNLTNILVAHRRQELLIMRINGFSLKQVIGYLARESLFTTAIGIVLGIGVGIPFSRTMVGAVSNVNTTLSNSFVLIAWAAALVLSVIFALIINSICFRNVGKASLVSITQ